MDADQTPQVQYFLIQVNILTAGREGFDLAGSVKTVSALLNDYHKCTKCLYKYKVTGETKLLAVFEVMDVIGLERMANGLTMLGYTEVICDPLVQYEEFAKRLGVDQSLTAPSAKNMKAEQCLWAEFTVEYAGKSMSDLLSVWKSEATTAMTVRQAGTQLELYKVTGQRKVHLFIEKTSEEFDEISFHLPVMQQNGDNVKIVTKRLQNLDVYVDNITAD